MRKRGKCHEAQMFFSVGSDSLVSSLVLLELKKLHKANKIY